MSRSRAETSTWKRHHYTNEGDTIYAPDKGLASIETLASEYQELLSNATIGYSNFLQQGTLKGGVHGTWDDHDYGGNDYGDAMAGKHERRNALLDFFQQSTQMAESKASEGNLHNPDDVTRISSERYHRQGVYNSVTFGEPPQQVKVIFLDTRWARQDHCIPSLGTTRIPLGNILACLTRWITAGLLSSSTIDGGTNHPNLEPACLNNRVLDDMQWKWLEGQIKESKAQVHVIVSSIQVLTTNPVVESWGHFPKERTRLLSLLNRLERGVILLSGDVHHGEILRVSDTNQGGRGASTLSTDGGIMEVTSSGLTHSCNEPFYGPLCAPILDTFSFHRYKKGRNKGYFTGRNFGSIEIDWCDSTENHDRPSMKVNVHDHLGNLVLTTGSQTLLQYSGDMSDTEIKNIPNCIDGHLIPILSKAVGVFLWIVLILMYRTCCRKNNTSVHVKKKIRSEMIK